MATFKSSMAVLSECERISSVDQIRSALEEAKVRLPFFDTPLARHGTARHGTARHGTARHGTARHGTARHGTVRYGTVRDGMLWDSNSICAISTRA